MPIEEKALNSSLAEALSELPNRSLHAVPELTRKSSGNKRCDVRVYRKYGDRYFAAIECKIGQSRNQLAAAVKDAQRWLKDSNCWNAIAVCYPAAFAEDSVATPRRRIEKSHNISMVRVNHGGIIGRWKTGSVYEISTLADDIGANETYAITDILKRSILAASENLNTEIGKQLSNVLEIPYEPKKKGLIDPRPARIACLIIANMMMLQNRMISAGVPIRDLQKLIEIRIAPNKQVSLLDNWQRIRNVDYAPAIDPAMAVLESLPSDHHTETLLDRLIEAVLECVPRMRGLQLDHAGPLYHQLLQTARYDGSFYTSTAAAVLLAELAMPPDWNVMKGEWHDTDKIVGLKICDPACGTGTLLMAAAKTIQERYLATGGDREHIDALHLHLIEDVLHGLDINRHAIHLAAAMLTLIAPKIDYNRMNLYNMQHGVDEDGAVRAGSLDLLVSKFGELFPLTISPKSLRVTAKGYQEQPPELEGICDLVIMNPPFTRNDIRNRSLPKADRKKVQEHEVQLAKKVSDYVRREAINQSTVSTFFVPIADHLLNSDGSLAIVQPFTACTAASGKGLRNLLTTRFHVELVITSHDNRRIYFSENTNIHESLIVARRLNDQNRGKPTLFVSLADNPANPSEAHFLAEAIRQSLNGDNSSLANYGTIVWRHIGQGGRMWNATCFYNQRLADEYDALLGNSSLITFKDVAKVEPGGQRVRDAFTVAEIRQNPDMRAIWHHKSERQIAMHTSHDSFLVAKKDMQDYAEKLWLKRSSLLVVNRMRLNLTRTPTIYSEMPILGSAFIPVLPISGNKEEICKAWCAWLNSTFGILCFLNIRQKNLSYPHFSLDGLRSLPVPNPDKCYIKAMTDAFNRYAGETLLPFPELPDDPIRKAIDSAIIRTVPGLSESDAEWIRQAIAEEPSVTGSKEQ